MAEETKEVKSKDVKAKEVKKTNYWFLSTVLLIIALVAVTVFFSMSPTGAATGISANDAAKNAVTWISDYFKSQDPNISVKLINYSDAGNGLYEFTVEISSAGGDSFASYHVTKDGKLFLPTAIDLTQKITEGTQAINKTDKPEVNLFVMAFCPYGVQAENIMKPVVDLLGAKADIKVHFIVNVQGSTIDTVSSLHGASEAKEDARQVCIMKYYDQATYWKYLTDINTNCYPSYSDATKLDACWKQAAQKFGIDTAKIETCAYGSEGLSLLKADEQLADQYGVSGSPTLIINGQVYSGSRTSDAFKEGICSAFTTAPSECSQALSTNSTTASGNC
jgi:predicted DsbA family dithiol-disulfide isomerase